MGVKFRLHRLRCSRCGGGKTVSYEGNGGGWGSEEAVHGGHRLNDLEGRAAAEVTGGAWREGTPVKQRIGGRMEGKGRCVKL